MQANYRVCFYDASSIHQCPDRADIYESISPYSQTQTRKSSCRRYRGTRGIGEGIVRRFVEEGAKVVFSGRSHEKGKVLEEELSPNVAFYRADPASASDTEALMKFAVERFGRLDCVVNNAGVGGEGGPIAGTSIEGFNNRLPC